MYTVPRKKRILRGILFCHTLYMLVLLLMLLLVEVLCDSVCMNVVTDDADA